MLSSLILPPVKTILGLAFDGERGLRLRCVSESRAGFLMARMSWHKAVHLLMLSASVGELQFCVALG